MAAPFLKREYTTDVVAKENLGKKPASVHVPSLPFPSLLSPAPSSSSSLLFFTSNSDRSSSCYFPKPHSLASQLLSRLLSWVLPLLPLESSLDSQYCHHHRHRPHLSTSCENSYICCCTRTYVTWGSRRRE